MEKSFKSIRSGRWEDGATWGNKSPGIGGVDWPLINKNIAWISPGTKVCFYMVAPLRLRIYWKIRNTFLKALKIV